MVPCFHILKESILVELIFQRKVGHVINLLFAGHHNADDGRAKCAEEQQEGDNPKPLDSLY